jgi:hypothetical protein
MAAFLDNLFPVRFLIHATLVLLLIPFWACAVTAIVLNGGTIYVIPVSCVPPVLFLHLFL